MPLTTDQLIAQSKAMLAQTAAEGTKAFAGSSYDTVNPNTPVAQTTPTITASALQPKTALNFQTPQTTLIPTVSAPTKTAEDIVNDMYGTPTKNEGQITELERSIAELTGKAAQEESRRAQLIGTPEFEAKRQQISSLVARANALSAEAQAIPLQMQQQIQEGGANVTKGGIAPIQTAALRNNAIQALSTGALLSAAQGDLTSALDQVDRAVAAEFEPIKAQLAAKRANLEMLMNDPATTREEKRRAALAEVQLKKIETEQATKEENRKSIQALALQAQENGAPDVIVNNIMKSQDMESAIGSSQGWAAKQTAQSIQEYNFAVKNGYKGSFTQYQNEDANRKIAVAKAGVAKTASGLPSNIATQVDKLSSAFDSSPIVKNYNEVQNKKLSVDSILQTGIKGPADLALVYEFMKALDPTSVVRETEYSTAAASGNIFSGLYAKYNGYLTEGGGFLPEGVRKDFQSIINKKFDVATSQYENLRKETARKIDMKTGSGDGVDYLTDYASASTQPKISKGSMSDAQFVEKAVKNSGQSYNDILSLAQKGEVAVVNNSTGEIEFIPAESVTSAYTRL